MYTSKFSTKYTNRRLNIITHSVHINMEYIKNFIVRLMRAYIMCDIASFIYL